MAIREDCSTPAPAPAESPAPPDGRSVTMWRLSPHHYARGTAEIQEAVPEGSPFAFAMPRANGRAVGAHHSEMCDAPCQALPLRPMSDMVAMARY
jgi:hypothetical protein